MFMSFEVWVFGEFFFVDIRIRICIRVYVYTFILEFFFVVV